MRGAHGQTRCKFRGRLEDFHRWESMQLIHGYEELKHHERNNTQVDKRHGQHHKEPGMQSYESSPTRSFRC
jgi:hypothetical protein